MTSLLLLHGFTGAPSSFGRAVEALPRSLPVLSPWLTGHGLPPAAPEVTHFEAEVARLARLLPPGQRHFVVGYSLGARLALGLLVRYPALFAGAVLVSGSAGLASEAEREERRRQDAALGRRLERDGLEAFVAHWEALPLFATQAALPEAERDAERRRRLAHRAEGLARSLAVTGLGEMPDYSPLLAAVGAPVELLAGELDERFCAHAAAIVGKLPAGRFTRVAGAGHNLLLERPESVTQAIVRGVLP